MSTGILPMVIQSGGFIGGREGGNWYLVKGTVELRRHNVIRCTDGCASDNEA